MTRVPVVWWSHDETDLFRRGYWDQGIIEGIFARSFWLPPRAYSFIHYPGFHRLPEGSPGAIIIIAGRWHAGNEPMILECLNRLTWAIVIVTGDEEGIFDWRSLQANNRKIWVQTPHPSKGSPDRKIGDGWRPGTRELLNEIDKSCDLNWSFAGQVNNEPRARMVRNLVDRLLSRGDGQLHLTGMFGSGLDQKTYLQTLVDSKLVLAPPGNFTPDTFRLFEALEVGTVPIASASAPNTPEEFDYWEFLFDEAPPFPVIRDDEDYVRVIDATLASWPAISNRVASWWLRKRRELGSWLDDDLQAVGAPRPEPASPNDLITVVIPTSPIPSHPSTAIIEQTLDSISSAGLDGVEIIILIDGVRAEQEHLREQYENYQQALLNACRARRNLLPLRFDAHHHQAEMTRHALNLVRTPLILFVEHDTPLEGEIPFDSLCQPLLSNDLDLIRLYPEVSIPTEHNYLMLDDAAPVNISGIPIVRTIQWSQRPQLAMLSYYHRVIGMHFAPGEKSMVEDRMHGIVQSEPWEHNRIGIYAPEGNMKRSGHLDGRGTEPKWVSG